MQLLHSDPVHSLISAIGHRAYCCLLILNCTDNRHYFPELFFSSSSSPKGCAASASFASDSDICGSISSEMPVKLLSSVQTKNIFIDFQFIIIQLNNNTLKSYFIFQ
jgi:hypothetical protein